MFGPFRLSASANNTHMSDLKSTTVFSMDKIEHLMKYCENVHLRCLINVSVVIKMNLHDLNHLADTFIFFLYI